MKSILIKQIFNAIEPLKDRKMGYVIYDSYHVPTTKYIVLLKFRLSHSMCIICTAD